jgi:hypothetical protein
VRSSVPPSSGGERRPSEHVRGSEIDRLSLFLFSQALLGMLKYINLNEPPIELFDFGYAVQLWLHYANHRSGASAQTTTLQRERALQIQAYPWGVCEIPLEIRGEGSDDSQEEAEEHSDS